MTLSTTSNTQSYTGNGSTTAFSFPYLFYANGDLNVFVDGVLQTITTHYTVSGAGDSNGGTVTFLTAPANGEAVIIQREVDLLQNTDLENFDGNPADVTEKQFDLLVMADQQIDEAVDRAILAPLGTTLTSNAISGTIDSTTRVLTLTTSGPATGTLADLSTSIDVVLSGEASGDFLRYDGTNWVNVTEIDTDDLADDAITAEKIDDGAVGSAALAANAVTPAKVNTTVNAIGSIGGGTQDIDLDLGLSVSATVDTSETTFTFSNPKATGNETIFTLRLTNGGSQTVNWPASVEWIDGTAPDLTSSGVDELVFKTIDGGTAWVGAAILDVS